MKVVVRVLLLLSLLFGSVYVTHAQNFKRYGGSHAKNKRKSSGAKRNKNYKKLSKNSRKKVKTRQTGHHKMKKYTNRKRTSVAKKGKSGKNKHKSKSYKGKYSNSRHQFGTKLEALVSGGVVANNTVSLADNELITEGSQENKTGYHLAAGMLYHLSNNIGVQGDIHISRLPKENSFVDLTGMGIYGKWNFTSYKKKFSAFMIGGISIDNWNYEYRDFTQDIPVTNSGNEEFATVTIIETKYASYHSGSELLFGYKIGAGFDLQFNRNFGSFFQIGYAQNQSQKFNFTVSNVTVDIGIKIALLKTKSLY